MNVYIILSDFFNLAKILNYYYMGYLNFLYFNY